jgi:hypothetical protein
MSVATGTAFSELMFTELKIFDVTYSMIPYAEFHASRAINVEKRDRHLFNTGSKVWLSLS